MHFSLQNTGVILLQVFIFCNQLPVSYYLLLFCGRLSAACPEALLSLPLGGLRLSKGLPNGSAVVFKQDQP